MIDFNSKTHLADRINHHIDTALEMEERFQPKRNYLGGSRLGVECERALQYEFWQVPVDEGKEFPGRVLRVFARGHLVEEAMLGWLLKAGFGILSEKRDGGQFGFRRGDIAGHCDGIFIAGPEEFAPYPRLWECKGIQEKYFNALKKNKLKKEYPVYYAQVQVYMKEFGLTDNPALFSAVNMNTMEMYWEEVPFCEEFVKGLEAKADRILAACKAGELLPRFWHDKNYFKCKWCNWRGSCWGGE